MMKRARVPLMQWQGGVFVGRHREMDQLKSVFEEVLSGKGRMLDAGRRTGHWQDSHGTGTCDLCWYAWGNSCLCGAQLRVRRSSSLLAVGTGDPKSCRSNRARDTPNPDGVDCALSLLRDRS